MSKASASAPAAPATRRQPERDPTNRDRQILRDLARRLGDIASRPEQETKAEMWRRHNRLDRVKPPVLVMLSGAWNEMAAEAQLQCDGEFAQSYERDLRRRIFQHEHFPDDRIVTTHVPVPLVMTDTGWGIDAKVTAPEQKTGAKHYDSVLETEADLDRLRSPRLIIDPEATDRNFAAAQELFGDLLTVERTLYWGNNYGLAPMDTLAVWRGFDRLFVDLVDNPQFVHRAMTMIVDGHLGMLDQLEAEGRLQLNNARHEFVGTGAVGFTDELPAPGFDPSHVRPRDLWVTCAAQIFAEVSPAMHEEFCLQHERRYLDRFGLVCYGCCEPLHQKLGILKKLPNLRRVSISPWADVAESAEQLGDRYIFSWKPNPAIIAAESWDPAAARRQLREFLEITRGCIVEIVLKDLETCRGEPHRLTEWAAIAREETEEFR